MILARCPHCATTFRAAPEALKQRAGKVRCGQCRQVFNALDHLVGESAAPTQKSPAALAPPFSGLALSPQPVAAAGTDPEPAPAEDAGTPPGDSLIDPAGPAADQSADQADAAPALDYSELAPSVIADGSLAAAVEISAFDDLGSTANPTTSAPKPPESEPTDGLAESPPALIENPEFQAAPYEEWVVTPLVTPADGDTTPDSPSDSGAPTNSETDQTAVGDANTDAIADAQAAGLMAARDSSEVPGYSRWAEGTLSAPSMSFDEPHRTGWMAVMTLIILGLMLIVQVVHYWRMEIASQWPELRPWLEEACQSAHCTVPYPRDVSQINLEASELQIDPARGDMLVLNMTIKNRAPFPQAFPSVELTLTDVRDNVVVRRILSPSEWLPDLDANASKADKNPISTPVAFPANKEIGARLWIDAKDTGAVGYRLFVFYP